MKKEEIEDYARNKIENSVDEMMQEISWEEFRDSGLLWFTNSILHNFGMAIAIDFDSEKAVKAYPARVKYRGFDEKTNDLGYYKVSKYLSDNAQTLLSECDKPEQIDNCGKRGMKYV